MAVEAVASVMAGLLAAARTSRDQPPPKTPQLEAREAHPVTRGGLEGSQGLLEEGGTGRQKAMETLASSLGGHLVSLDYAFGDDDVYAICELSDDETAAAVSLRLTASGAVNTKTIKLLSPDQIDAATQRELEYRKPGA